jgi:hypothetical protein
MDTEKYCEKLNCLDKTEAIRAIHEAYLQLKAMGEIVNDRESYQVYDNRPVLKNLKKCLVSAGHIGFN